MKRIIPYLLLNVIVSATTVVVVLLIWTAVHPALQTGNPQSAAATMPFSATALPTATLPPLTEKLFEIQSVVGTGDLANEHLHILYLGDTPLNIQNWEISDKNRHSYYFPAFVLFSGGAFDLYTKAGSNSTIELFMGQTKAIYTSGEQIKLLDPVGNIRLQYQIP